MLDYLENLADAAYLILKEKFQYVFDALGTSENCRKETLTKKFDAYLQKLIVLGFNSSIYDLNLIKPKLIEHIYEKIDFVNKKANNYQCIKTNKLRFLDIRHFLAGGFSYDKFLKAYKIQQTKFFFPYEYCTSLDVLNEGLPSHEVFYSDLKKTNISEDQCRSTPTSGPPPKVSARAPAHRSYHFRGVKLKSCIKKIHHNLYISKQANVRIKHADTEGSSHKKFGTDARVQ